MKKIIRLFTCIAASISLALLGGGGASAATPVHSTQIAGVVPSSLTSSTIVSPQVAYIWWIWEDYYYTEATCEAAAFYVVSTHAYIHDYKCYQNDLNSAINPGRWSLWVWAPDGTYPLH